jgi:hypothetical protein
MVGDSRGEEICRILKAELEEARKRQACAAVFFACLIPDDTSGPAQVGSLRLHQAGAEAKDAAVQYARALKRFTDFVIYGIVPEDFLS